MVSSGDSLGFHLGFRDSLGFAFLKGFISGFFRAPLGFHVGFDLGLLCRVSFRVQLSGFCSCRVSYQEILSRFSNVHVGFFKVSLGFHSGF